jgi:hypothetical protein
MTKGWEKEAIERDSQKEIGGREKDFQNNRKLLIC